MTLIPLIALVFALVLALLATFNTPSRVNLLAAAFSFFILAELFSHANL